MSQQRQQRSLEERMQRLESWRDAEAEKIRSLEERIEKLERRFREKHVNDDELREEVLDLRKQVEELGGLAQGEESTPAARKRDLVLALKRRAESDPDGRVHMTYSEVINALNDLNHGSIYPAQAYDAMEAAAADVRGVFEGTFDGERVVRIDLEQFSENSEVNDV